jgi:hypothetical protein
MNLKTQAYAILRADSGKTRIEDAVTVVKILTDQESVAVETHRLNEINREKGCKYWWQATRIELDQNTP